MHNKKFDDLDENIRDLILDKKFEIKVTDSTLSEEELAAHFRIKQETMKTSIGEKLHCLVEMMQRRLFINYLKSIKII